MWKRISKDAFDKIMSNHNLDIDVKQVLNYNSGLCEYYMYVV